MKAQTKEEFKKAWKDELNTISLLYWSLPKSAKEPLLETIENLKSLIEAAADYTFPK